MFHNSGNPRQTAAITSGGLTFKRRLIRPFSAIASPGLGGGGGGEAEGNLGSSISLWRDQRGGGEHSAALDKILLNVFTVALPARVESKACEHRPGRGKTRLN